MRIVADENISLTDYFFSSFGTLSVCAGRKITAENLINADVLLVRSVTQVTPSLLNVASDQSTTNKRIGFVGSTTIGMDHIDVAGLQSMGVRVASAPGCNAQAVAEYVVTAIFTVQPLRAQVAGFTLGIVGLGNVGQRLTRLAKRLGWRVIGVDPFVRHDDIEQMTLKDMLPQVDAISLHVPMTRGGLEPTFHLINDETLALLKPDSILINSARGAVVEEVALFNDFAQARRNGLAIRSVVLDVYEHEPRIPARLLHDLALATPHIAGYTLEGKACGTEMIYQAFCNWQGVKPVLTLAGMLPKMPHLFHHQQSLIEQLPALLPQIYPIGEDDAALRACITDHSGSGESWVDANSFDRLRKEYPLRREWASYGDIT
jgi:erythronate-4-phosphate dehydrogenase